MRPDRLLRRLVQGHLENVAFADVQSLVTRLGFELQRINGSHHIYVHPGVDAPLNLQDLRGQAKPYQLRQLMRVIEQYDLRLENTS